MQRTTLTFITAFVVILFIALAFFARPSAPGTRETASTARAAHATSTLVTSARLFDFGTISMKNGNVEHAFTVENPTTQDVTLREVSTSCMCTTAFIVDGSDKEGPFGMPGMGGSTKTERIIKAGGKVIIDAVYDPNAHGPAGVGAIDRFISLVDTNGSKLELEIKAVVTP